MTGAQGTGRLTRRRADWKCGRLTQFVTTSGSGRRFDTQGKDVSRSVVLLRSEWLYCKVRKFDAAMVPSSMEQCEHSEDGLANDATSLAVIISLDLLHHLWSSSWVSRHLWYEKEGSPVLRKIGPLEIYYPSRMLFSNLVHSIRYGKGKLVFPLFIP